MAISRAQMLKELLPGLNALFGLEYEKYEDEIVEYIESEYGTEFLVDMFRDADASLTHYKNSVSWCFIEMIAMEAVEEHRYDYAIANGCIVKQA